MLKRKIENKKKGLGKEKGVVPLLALFSKLNTPANQHSGTHGINALDIYARPTWSSSHGRLQDRRECLDFFAAGPPNLQISGPQKPQKTSLKLWHGKNLSLGCLQNDHRSHHPGYVFPTKLQKIFQNFAATGNANHAFYGAIWWYWSFTSCEGMFRQERVLNGTNICCWRLRDFRAGEVKGKETTRKEADASGRSLWQLRYERHRLRIGRWTTEWIIEQWIHHRRLEDHFASRFETAVPCA